MPTQSRMIDAFLGGDDTEAYMTAADNRLFGSNNINNNNRRGDINRVVDLNDSMGENNEAAGVGAGKDEE